MVSVANETFKSLASDNSKIKPVETGKEINQGLRALYDSTLFAQTKGTTTADDINIYFSHLLEEENEITVIETILMTTLEQFGMVLSLN